MTLAVADMKKELASLKDKREEINRKIQGLEQYLGLTKANVPKSSDNGTSVRMVDLDVRPDVSKIYGDNGNQPIKFKDLVEMVAKIHPEFDKKVIKSKMVNVQRKMLEVSEYGMYRLKAETKTTDPIEEPVI